MQRGRFVGSPFLLLFSFSLSEFIVNLILAFSQKRTPSPLSDLTSRLKTVRKRQPAVASFGSRTWPSRL